VVTSTGWLEEQLIRAVERVETLTRDMAMLQVAAQVRDQEIDALRSSLATVDGRTQRHEASQDTVRWLQHAVAALDERLTEETALRREQVAAGDRGQERSQVTEQAAARALQALGERVEGVERALMAVQEHQARLGGEFGALLARDVVVSAYLDALGVQVQAASDAAQREVSSVALLEEAMAALEHLVRATEARTLGLQEQQQRFEGDLAALRRIDEHGRQLDELASHQRVLGARVEEGLTLLRESAASIESVQENEVQARALLRTRLGALEQALAATDAAVAGQREVLIEHFQRTTAAAAEAGRRAAEEIERQSRARRELLVRLSERADEASREQPL
jgi:hypothetical protein